MKGFGVGFIIGAAILATIGWIDTDSPISPFQVILFLAFGCVFTLLGGR